MQSCVVCSPAIPCLGLIFLYVPLAPLARRLRTNQEQLRRRRKVSQCAGISASRFDSVSLPLCGFQLLNEQPLIYQSAYIPLLFSQVNLLLQLLVGSNLEALLLIAMLYFTAS